MKIIVWISNTLVTDFKEKDKFKKDDILAKNNQYFSGEKGSAEYVTGCLTKVAIHGGLDILIPYFLKWKINHY